MELTNAYIQTWLEARTRFSNQLESITESDLTKKLGSAPNSLGFLFRHICEVELLFAKNVFGISELNLVAKTVIEKKDNGQWTNLPELLEFNHYAFSGLERAIRAQNDDQWSTYIETKEFGRKTKSEALGRIISHTGYHAGQMALIQKYGISN